MDFDPRDRDGDVRDVAMPWVELRDPERDPDGARERDDDTRDRDSRERASDPRDPFVHDLDLPRGLEREVVLDGDHRHELNGDDSRTLATVGAFRVASERDLRDPRDDLPDWREPDLRHLRSEGLLQSVKLDGRDRAVTLTDRGRHLLDTHRRDHDEKHPQTFHAGVSRARELSHDVQVYQAYRREHERLHAEGAEIQRVVLESELKREYQEWLQESNRGRPDRDPREIEDWAREHDLPYFDESVHFPDVRVEYEVQGRDRHEDVEVVTEHYRGGHARGVARSGFRCYGRGGGSGRRGGRSFDPDLATQFL